MPNVPAAPLSVLAFELVGRGPVHIVGPVSGRRYHWRRTGDTVRVDPRDRPALAVRTDLRWIR
jgi:hypothetical protein